MKHNTSLGVKHNASLGVKHTTSLGVKPVEGAEFGSEQLQIPICELCGAPRFNIRVILWKSRLVYSLLVTFISSARGDARASESSRPWIWEMWAHWGCLCCSCGKCNALCAHSSFAGPARWPGGVLAHHCSSPGELSELSSWCQGVEAVAPSVIPMQLPASQGAWALLAEQVGVARGTGWRGCLNIHGVGWFGLERSLKLIQSNSAILHLIRLFQHCPEQALVGDFHLGGISLWLQS